MQRSALQFIEGWVGDLWGCYYDGGEGGVRFEAVSEMPRPYVNVVLQATEHTRFLKNSLTRRGDAPNKLLNLLEQLLHKIKAKRRREMGLQTFLLPVANS